MYKNNAETGSSCLPGLWAAPLLRGQQLLTVIIAITYTMCMIMISIIVVISSSSS